MYEALVIALACLLGCFCTGYYLVRVLKGEDIRDLASDNVCGLWFSMSCCWPWPCMPIGATFAHHCAGVNHQMLHCP